MIKIRTINSTLAAMSLGAFATACGGIDTNASVDQAGFESVDPTIAADTFGTAEEEVTVCDDHQYDHWRYMADLGVAAAQELGRWQPTVDFRWTGIYTGLALSPAGLARCAAVAVTAGLPASEGTCDNIQAILSLQTNGTGVIYRHDSTLFRAKLQVAWERQGIFNQNSPVVAHDLTPTSISSATCGSRYWFQATGTAPAAGGGASTVCGTTTLVFANSNSCMDVSGVSYNDGALMQQYACSNGANQKFTVEAVSGGYRFKANHSGKCLRATSNGAFASLEQRSCDTTTNQLFDVVSAGNGKYQLKNRAGGMCAEVANYSTANGAQVRVNTCASSAANQQFTMSGATVTTAPVAPAGGTAPVAPPLANPGALLNSLLWVGGADNAYLAFQTNGSEVSIDPTGTMIDGAAAAQSGACVLGTSLMDSTKTSGGKCCTYWNDTTGKYFVGALLQTTFNKSLYYCK